MFSFSTATATIPYLPDCQPAAHESANESANESDRNSEPASDEAIEDSMDMFLTEFGQQERLREPDVLSDSDDE